MLDEENSTLLIGNKRGGLLQLSFDFQGNFGKILKDYGDLGIGGILSSYLLGNIAVFGGRNRKLAFINTQKREFLGYSFDLAPQYIESIELCWIHKQTLPKALLTVSGEDYNYNEKTDVLDVTLLFPKHMRNQNNQNMLESNQEIFETNQCENNKFPVNLIKLSSKKLNNFKKDLS